VDGARYVASDGGSITAEQQQANVINSIPPVAPGSVKVATQTLATGFAAPLFGTAAPGIAAALFVVDQVGRVWRVDTRTGAKTSYLDVTSLLVHLGASAQGYDERGLLGLAFHPQFAQNGLLYTYTSEPVNGSADFTFAQIGANCSDPAPSVAPDHQNVIREWHVANAGDPSVASGAAGRVVLRLDWPAYNHDGGMLAFGPDGMLYVSLGDGGGEDDQTCQLDSDGKPTIGHASIGNAQDTSVAYGKLLRINPTGRTSTSGAYAVPLDNPFAHAGSGILPEIYAVGLRNFWRYSFDPLTGALIGNDVGQNNIEEVDVIRAGGNYGWRIKEGTALFDPGGLGLTQSGDTQSFDTYLSPNFPAGLVDPIAQYGHTHFAVIQGRASIGGFVYRGEAIPDLAGKYVFGDWTQAEGLTPAGAIFALDTLSDDELRGLSSGQLPSWGADRVVSLLDQPLDLFTLGFGRDDVGELYVLGNATGTPLGQTGELRRIVPARTADAGVGPSDGGLGFPAPIDAGFGLPPPIDAGLGLPPPIDAGLGLPPPIDAGRDADAR
jgi:glucose/arabinose dehydrogenase